MGVLICELSSCYFSVNELIHKLHNRDLSTNRDMDSLMNRCCFISTKWSEKPHEKNKNIEFIDILNDKNNILTINSWTNYILRNN